MAATRFFIGYNTATNITPSFDAGWEQTGPSLRKKLIYKNNTTTLDTIGNATITNAITTTQDYLFYQLISDPIPPQLITGTVSAVFRCSETNAGSNATLAFIAKVVSQDGTVIRGTLFSNFSNDSEFALDASAATRIVNAQAVTTTTTQPGDRILIEYGTHVAAPTASAVVTIRIGNTAATDFALTSGLTTDLNPWIEFSQDLFGTQLNNYQFVKVGDGMSTGEKIR